MPPKKINAKEFVKCVESGMTKLHLMDKYDLSAKQLEKVFLKAREEGLLPQTDTEEADYAHYEAVCKQSHELFDSELEIQEIKKEAKRIDRALRKEFVLMLLFGLFLMILGVISDNALEPWNNVSPILKIVIVISWLIVFFVFWKTSHQGASNQELIDAAHKGYFKEDEFDGPIG